MQASHWAACEEQTQTSAEAGGLGRDWYPGQRLSQVEGAGSPVVSATTLSLGASSGGARHALPGPSAWVHLIHAWLVMALAWT